MTLAGGTFDERDGGKCSRPEVTRNTGHFIIMKFSVSYIAGNSNWYASSYMPTSSASTTSSSKDAQRFDHTKSFIGNAAFLLKLTGIIYLQKFSSIVCSVVRF